MTARRSGRALEGSGIMRSPIPAEQLAEEVGEMTTRLLAFALASLVPAAAAAQHFHHRIAPDPDDNLRVSVCDDKRYLEPEIDPSQQGVPWEVTPTKNRVAVLAHFNQGMTLLYG